jgi:hypothetical protein
MRTQAANALRMLHKHLDPMEIHHEDKRLNMYPFLKEYMHHARMPDIINIPNAARLGFFQEHLDRIEKYQAGGNVHAILQSANFLICLLAGLV